MSTIPQIRQMLSKIALSDIWIKRMACSITFPSLVANAFAVRTQQSHQAPGQWSSFSSKRVKTTFLPLGYLEAHHTSLALTLTRKLYKTQPEDNQWYMSVRYTCLWELYATHLWTGPCQACQLTALWFWEEFPLPFAPLKAISLLTNFSTVWQQNLWICINHFLSIFFLKIKEKLERTIRISHTVKLRADHHPLQSYFLLWEHHIALGFPWPPPNPGVPLEVLKLLELLPRSTTTTGRKVTSEVSQRKEKKKKPSLKLT